METPETTQQGTKYTRRDKKPRFRKYPSRHSKYSESHLTMSSGISGYISTFILLILILITYLMISHPSSNTDINFKALKTELVDKVHHQPNALVTVINALEKMEKEKHFVGVVNFIGSTGVGKTFIANILKRHFSRSVHEFRGPLETTDEKLLNTIRDNYFRYNLLLFDDLTTCDLDFLLPLLMEPPNDVNLLILCIFNIQETDHFFNRTNNYDYVDIIEERFNKVEINHKSVKFHEFTVNEAADWIEKQLIKEGVDVDLHSKIIESVLHNHNIKYQGLKGLSSKLNVEL